MPAVLDEAFNSPFNRNLGAQVSTNSSTDTESIRNPNEDAQNTQYQSFNHPFNSLFPRAQHNMYAAPSSMQPQFKPQQIPQPQPQPQFQQTPHPQPLTHDCERLIAMMMACAICRNKIREILKTDTPVSQPVPPIHQNQNQSGGALGINLDTTVIGNFIFGIAIIFLVDKIVKKRGCC